MSKPIADLSIPAGTIPVDGLFVVSLRGSLLTLARAKEDLVIETLQQVYITEEEPETFVVQDFVRWLFREDLLEQVPYTEVGYQLSINPITQEGPRIRVP